ncbi:transposase, partial [Streptomyces sp. NPDC102274]|uniref:transposase n=1 Tax=Streptomyces sp. NPDC102274 TaxID=3366151 RepID=UPI003815C617
SLGQVKADGARTAQFKRVCTDCPLRGRRTTSTTGRTLNVHPQHELLATARAQAATDPAWQAEYRRWRPPVERAIAWLVAKGNRRVPHRGVIANNIWLHHRAVALNLRRLINLGLTRANDSWHLTPATP